MSAALDQALAAEGLVPRRSGTPKRLACSRHSPMLSRSYGQGYDLQQLRRRSVDTRPPSVRRFTRHVHAEQTSRTLELRDKELVAHKEMRRSSER